MGSENLYFESKVKSDIYYNVHTTLIKQQTRLIACLQVDIGLLSMERVGFSTYFFSENVYLTKTFVHYY